MSEVYDVVVIGAGIMGLSTAYYLKQKGCRRILVLEKEKSWVTGSSARANGGFRQQFSTPLNIKLSQISLPVFEQFEEELGSDISFRQYGYLFVTATERGERTLKENLSIQRKSGVPVEWIEPSELTRIAPCVQKEHLRGGTFCPLDGYADSYSIAAGFGQAALRLGVKLRTEEPVIGITAGNGRVNGVRTPKGLSSTSVVVNAAGPYASRIGELAGISIPVSPVRRMLIMTEEFPSIPDSVPMIIDADSGFFLRKESGRVLMGWSDPEEPESYNLSFDPAFIDTVAEKAIMTIPCLSEVTINSRKCWAGLYEVTPDHHCILGKTPLRGFYVANGFSGHGMMHSPAVGMIMADLIVDGHTELMDIHPLRLARFSEGDLIHEKVVI